MAIALDNTSQGDTTGTSLTFSHTNTAGNLLVVTCGVPASDLITGVTYNGTSLTLVDKIASPAPDGRWCYMFYLVNPATGAHNVVVSSSSSDFLYANAASYTGAKTTGQPEASATGTTSSSTSSTATVTTTATDAWTVATFRTNDGAFPTVTSSPSGAVVRRTGDSAGALYDSNGGVGSGGSKTITVTYGGNRYYGWVIASFAPGGTDFTRSLSDSISVGASRVTTLAFVKGVVRALSDSISIGASRTIDLTRSASSFARSLSATMLGGTTSTIAYGRGLVRGLSDSIMNGAGRFARVRFPTFWTRQAKNTATFTNQTKNSSSWTNQNKS